MISRCSCAVLVLILFLAAQSYSQSTAETPPQAPSYTIRANSRVVLTDVTVTDGNGNPVHGLPESAFRIFDNKPLQVITSFEEHAGASAVATQQAELASASPASAGIYSNNYLLHLPPVLNVIVIDIANLNVPDQMYLNYELTKFLSELPEGQPIAIYLCAANCFLTQNFTSDRKLLLDAVHKAIPRFPPTGREYLSDIDTLHQIAVSLDQLPGRKNLLWFSGGTTLFLLPDPTAYSQNYAAWRNLYDELEQERIAVYPIDARGLTRYNSRAMVSQHFVMNDVAEATAGQAFYNSNGLKEITEHLLSSDGSFYTLTYSPHDFHFDNKWHKVRVEVSGAHFHISYRSGYFADGSVGGVEQPAKLRTRLFANGERIDLSNTRSLPIIFQVRVMLSSDPSVTSLPAPSSTLPAPPLKKGSVPFLLRYSLPMDGFTPRIVDGKSEVVLVLGALILTGDGHVRDRHTEEITLTLNKETLQRKPNTALVMDQTLNLIKGDQYLSLVVWDMSSGRQGTLQIPVDVSKKQAKN
ncbi:MAG TPA: VWA domain-containing protein [Pseudacidobacterium sp.]|nr:VWA domain-containing protein [Pseudacidobacterium sp.]